jgi:large subunit ribosomal protein L5
MTDFEKKWAAEPMTKPHIAKVVANIGVGAGGEETMTPAMNLLEKITGKKPVKTYSKCKIPAWGLREGLPIGTKVTLRGELARDFLERSTVAVEKTLKERNFDKAGNLSFGIEQYVFYDGVKYDPDIGTMGLQVSVTIERPGFRVKQRKIKTAKLGKGHIIPKDEAIAFITKEFGVTVENE